jgi:hypothetical protein
MNTRYFYEAREIEDRWFRNVITLNRDYMRTITLESQRLVNENYSISDAVIFDKVDWISEGF